MKTIHLETWIKADQRAVFEALTSRTGLDAWWGTCVAADPEVGAIVEFDHGLGAPLRMRVTELVDGSRLVWRCVSDVADPANPASEWLGTSLTFELRSALGDPAFDWMAPRLGYDRDTGGPVTILEFRHTDWPAGARWYPFCNAACRGATLGVLARHCESIAAM